IGVGQIVLDWSGADCFGLAWRRMDWGRLFLIKVGEIGVGTIVLDWNVAEFFVLEWHRVAWGRLFWIVVGQIVLDWSGADCFGLE
ncbi:hypothetical protein NDU88_005944, partial [Pleurodeles waltl]